MTSDNGGKVIVITESLCYIRSKLHANTSLRWATTRFSLWVGPKHFHHQTFLSRLTLVMSVQLPDVVQGDLVIREQPSVQNKILVSNQSSQRQRRERLAKQSKSPFVIFRFAFTLEPIGTVHVVSLVVSSVNEERLWTKPL